MLFVEEIECSRTATWRPIPEDPPVMSVVEDCGPVSSERDIVNASVAILE